MLGAIAGDIIGSIYEFRAFKSKEFPLFSDNSHFTDDSVLTVAIAAAISEAGDYADFVRRIGRRYPLAGYGARFHDWLLNTHTEP